MNVRYALRVTTEALMVLLIVVGLYACAVTKVRPAAEPVAQSPRERAEMQAPPLGEGSVAHGAPLVEQEWRGAGAFRAEVPEADVDIPEFGAVDEVWVIARAGGSVHEHRPYAELRARRADGGQETPLPLKHTDVRVQVSGYIASVNVTQQYHNPFSERIEAVYVFPLPENAAVSEFVMTIGKRHIRGIIREREQAARIYAEAKNQGYVTSLLTQERPNVFTQSVANIEPGKRIEIELTYFNPLRYSDGEYELIFPMVVGPRFNPPRSHDGIGSVALGESGESHQPVELQYLEPRDVRSGHDIGLSVDVDAGVSIESLTSPSHAIETERLSLSRQRVSLSRLDTVPNRDFVLRYKVAGRAVKTAFLSHRDKRGGFFTLMLQPPAELTSLARSPLELVFVLDCSGSMSGYPIEKAKVAMQRALRRLGSDDTFQIVRFSDSASQLGSAPVPATADNVERALAYVQGLNGEGGTMMINGIKAALDFAHDPRRLRIVSFMTDGFIGNEAEILAEIHQRLGAARIFSFGIGSSVNRYLLDGMARIGHGAVAYIGVEEGAERAVDAFYESVQHPALTDISIDWGGLAVSDVYPQRVPDLFVGRPVIVSGRFKGRGATAITVRGNAGGERSAIRVLLDPGATSQRHPAIANVWARTKLAALDAAEVERGRDLSSEIKKVALEYGLMSKHTSFIAVDSRQRTAGTHGTTVLQPVPVPKGVRYETSVTGRR